MPQDLSLVGYPNNSEARLTNPPLTVIDAMFERVGEESVKQLMGLIANPGMEPTEAQTVIAPQLIVRGSTGPAPARKTKRTRAASRASSSSANPSSPLSSSDLITADTRPLVMTADR